MRERIKRALRTITDDERTEARWLNTLSYLEFVGARKISRTVAASHPGTTVLGHLADEARHAAVFSDLAQRILGTEPAEYLCQNAARTYFHKLDRELTAWVEDITGQEHPALRYLLVTAMIEHRALVLYPLYRSASSHEVVRDEMKTLIEQEQGHRARIAEDCVRLLSEWDIRDLSAPSAVESAFFAEFWTAIEAELGLEEPLAAA